MLLLTMEELVEVKSIRLEDMELVFEVWNKSDMSLRIHSIVVYKVLPKPRVKKRFFGLIATIKERERVGICIPIPYEEVPPAGNSHLRVPLKYVPEGRCIIKLSGYFIAGELQYSAHPLVSKTVERRFEKLHEFSMEEILKT